ncbi:MAG: hypothetical protein NTZ05_07140 [Chloroflexi bacterium]|nr:hypothetical protein [Chloroflexota bacterium]
MKNREQSPIGQHDLVIATADLFPPPFIHDTPFILHLLHGLPAAGEAHRLGLALGTGPHLGGLGQV